MIFSSNAFVFAFLPLALLGYFAFARLGLRAANAWLAAASLVFYSYWNPWWLVVLLGSITWNYSIGAWIFRLDESRDRQRLAVLWLGIVGNLALLFHYKYLFPLVEFFTRHELVAAPGWITDVALPLGISFFTFTQIGYLLDSYSGQAKERGLVSYLVFVTFFPHLIAGPILHNREILPQIADPETKRFRASNLAIGLSIFAIGMGKKVLLADSFAYMADTGFERAGGLATADAWIAVMAYSLQLYFDFSGYSDMAIGLARMFGIVFPVNFNSPYKAASIIDFWSRWHMTLTRYLTLYLYNPIAMRVSRRRMARGLSSSRKATRNLPAYLSLVVMPTFVTMGLAGIWHGAGLQFLVFGLLHAGYLSINHAWRIFGPQDLQPSWPRTILFMALTYGAVLVGQVFFRAESVGDAVALLKALCGLDAPVEGLSLNAGLGTLLRIAVGYAICLALPNTQQIMRDFRPILEKVTEPRGLAITWRPNLLWAVGLGGLLLIALLRMSDVSKFLYFQF